eukprot:4416382-Prorocentrum_lima.AAC.1
MLDRLLAARESFVKEQLPLRGRSVHLCLPTLLLDHCYRPSRQSSLILIDFQIVGFDELTMDCWGLACDSI